MKSDIKKILRKLDNRCKIRKLYKNCVLIWISTKWIILKQEQIVEVLCFFIRVILILRNFRHSEAQFLMIQTYIHGTRLNSSYGHRIACIFLLAEKSLRHVSKTQTGGMFTLEQTYYINAFNASSYDSNLGHKYYTCYALRLLWVIGFRYLYPLYRCQSPIY